MSQEFPTRKVLRHVAMIKATAERIFPLLCPTREYEWIDGWSCKLHYSESGFAEKGAVFSTDYRPEGTSIWTVTRYEPDQLIGFVVVFPGLHVMTVEIVLTAKDQDKTQLTWTCCYTSLIEHNDFMAGINQELFDLHQGFLDRALEYYCITGRMLGRDNDHTHLEKHRE